MIIVFFCIVVYFFLESLNEVREFIIFGIMIWLVKMLIVDVFEINIFEVFVKCGWLFYVIFIVCDNYVCVVFC